MTKAADKQGRENKEMIVWVKIANEWLPTLLHGQKHRFIFFKTEQVFVAVMSTEA